MGSFEENLAVKDHEQMIQAIVTEHEAVLLRYATRILVNRHHAQDVVQNVFVKLFKAWHEGLKAGPQLKSWLFKVTHNEAVDHIRREARLKVLHEKQEVESAVESDTRHDSGTMTDDERRAVVLKNLGMLSSSERQVLVLRLDNGMTYEQIASITGMSLNSVGVVLHNAVKKMSAILQKKGIVNSAEKRGGAL
jgi:RNA polymerase sigma-70 factor (ECF subfamily)